jgi:hypothetical protein
MEGNAAMKFLLTYQGDQTVPPTPEKMAAIGKFGQEMAAKGVLLMTGGLVRPDYGTKLKYADGKHTVTDGPFPETKELIDGFALVRCDSLQEAIAVGQAFMNVAGEGEAEVLQVFDASDGGPPTAPGGS